MGGTPWRALLAMLFVGFAAAGAARADEASDAELRKQIEELRRKVEALEKKASEGDGAPRAPAGEDDEAAALRADAAAAADDAEAKKKAAASAPGGGTSGGGGGGGGIVQQSLNLFNPRMSVFGDFTGRLALRDHPSEPERENEFNLREVEVDMRADVDPFSKAVMILAVERETADEDYEIGVEEGYLTLETLPWNFRAEIGRWRQRFGQANRTHVHDLMQIDYPVALRDFLGDEGLTGDGIGLLWLAPGIPLELEATVMNGNDETILAGAQSNYPAFLTRADLTLDLPLQTIGTFGASHLLGWSDDAHSDMTQLLGGDATLMWKPTSFRSVVLQGELYYLEKTNGDAARGDYAWGAYGALNVQPIQQLYLGTRYDFSQYGQQIEGDDTWAISFYASWYTTEFLRFRVGYIHEEHRTAGPDGRPDDDTLELQVTFIIGSHPAEPFWVNR